MVKQSPDFQRMFVSKKNMCPKKCRRVWQMVWYRRGEFHSTQGPRFRVCPAIRGERQRQSASCRSSARPWTGTNSWTVVALRPSVCRCERFQKNKYSSQVRSATARSLVRVFYFASCPFASSGGLCSMAVHIGMDSTVSNIILSAVLLCGTVSSCALSSWPIKNFPGVPVGWSVYAQRSAPNMQLHTYRRKSRCWV